MNLSSNRQIQGQQYVEAQSMLSFKQIEKQRIPFIALENRSQNVKYRFSKQINSQTSCRFQNNGFKQLQYSCIKQKSFIKKVQINLYKPSNKSYICRQHSDNVHPQQGKEQLLENDFSEEQKKAADIKLQAERQQQIDKQKVAEYKPKFSSSMDQERYDYLSKKVKKDMKGVSVFLVGMMGSGKSTVGNILAQSLNYRFADSDIFIEKALKGTCSEIFEEHGEEYFRNFEQEVVKQLSARRSMVVATGGGAVLRQQNWGAMRQGIVIFLNGPVDILGNRIVQKEQGLHSRPLLNMKDPNAPIDMEKENSLNESENGLENGLEKEQQEAEYKSKEYYNKVVLKLQKLSEDRKDKYMNADIIVSLKQKHGFDPKSSVYDKKSMYGATPQTMLLRLLEAIDRKIQQSKEEEESRKIFKIIQH